MAVQIEKRTFNVKEYHAMLDADILSEDDRVELIAGEILNMSPIGSRHAACVKRLNALLNAKVGQRAIVSVQDPIQIDDYSEPEPDVALLKPRDDFYAQALPGANDVLLVIEVADSSLAYDRSIKLPLYARAHIPEVWLVDLDDDEIEVCTGPMAGKYQTVRRAKRGDVLTPQTFLDVSAGVTEILG